MSHTEKNRTVILVNGIPASGKSTLAKQISAHFNFPYLVLDHIKEPFMALDDNLTREQNRLLGQAAYQAIWHTIAEMPNACIYVIDAWFGFRPKAELIQHIERARIHHVIEIWSQISPETVCQRYAARVDNRPPGHPGREYLPELKRLASEARPLNIGTTYVVHQESVALEATGQEMGHPHEQPLYAWIDAQIHHAREVA